MKFCSSSLPFRGILLNATLDYPKFCDSVKSLRVKREITNDFYHGTEMSPVKPMNASERRPAVTSAIGAPFIASGIS